MTAMRVLPEPARNGSSDARAVADNARDFWEPRADARRVLGTALSRHAVVAHTAAASSRLANSRPRLEAAPGLEPGNNGFAIRRLTTWLCRRKEAQRITRALLRSRRTRVTWCAALHFTRSTR